MAASPALSPTEELEEKQVSELSKRYDPKTDEPYGKCVTCGIVHQTEEDADVHRAQTMDESTTKRSHTTTITNPSRERRIQSAIDSIIGDAVDNALNEIDDKVDIDVTEDEVTNALKWWSDFLGTWEGHYAGVNADRR